MNASNPAKATNPSVGTTNLTGDQAGTDLSNRPMWPALFITDITTNLSNRSGDWQQGGTAGLPPNDIFSTWKGLVRTVDKTKTVGHCSITIKLERKICCQRYFSFLSH